MIRCWHIIALGLIALCSCASSPALSQGRSPERRPGREPLGPYIIQTEEEARRHLEAEEETRPREEGATLSDRVSRVEGRLEGMDEAAERATRSAEGVLTTVRWCTVAVSGLIVLVGALLVVVGLGERKNIEAIRQRAEQAIDRAEDAVRKASECAAAATDALANVQAAEERIRELLASAEKGEQVIGAHAHRARAVAAEILSMREQVKELHEPEPTEEVSAEERRADQHIARAKEFSAREEDERALLEYDRALSATPNDGGVHALRAFTLAILDRDEEALVALDRAAELRPDLGVVHWWRGLLLRDLGRYDDSLAACSRAIEVDPDDASGYYYRACAHARLNNKDEALRDLRRAIRLGSKFREMARTDRDHDFDNLRDDPEFKELVRLEEEEPT